MARKDPINPYSPEVSCLELAIASKIVNPNRNLYEKQIFVYTLKIVDINRFVGAASPSSYYQGQKVFTWHESEEIDLDPKSKTYKTSSLEKTKRKHLKLPFKFKYIKSDVIFEVASAPEPPKRTESIA